MMQNLLSVYRANDEFPLGVVLKFQRHTLDLFLNTDTLHSQECSYLCL